MKMQSLSLPTHFNIFQYSCPEHPMTRGAWWATVHRVAESDMTEVTQHTLSMLQRRKKYIVICLFNHSSVGKSSACNVGDSDLIPGKISWRRKWQPTPVFLPGESHGPRSLAGYSPQGCRVRHDCSDLAYQEIQKCIYDSFMAYVLFPFINVDFQSLTEVSCKE